MSNRRFIVGAVAVRIIALMRFGRHRLHSQLHHRINQSLDGIMRVTVWERQHHPSKKARGTRLLAPAGTDAGEWLGRRGPYFVVVEINVPLCSKVAETNGRTRARTHTSAPAGGRSSCAHVLLPPACLYTSAALLYTLSCALPSARPLMNACALASNFSCTSSLLFVATINYEYS